MSNKANRDFDLFDEAQQDDIVLGPTSITVHVTKHNSTYITSREIAQYLSQEHKNVLAAIRRIKKNDKINITDKMFFETSYKDSKNRPQPEFYVNQSGFIMLASNAIFTDQQMKAELIVAFQIKNEEIRTKLNDAEKEIEYLRNMPRETKVAQGLIAANEIINEQKQLITQQAKEIEEKENTINNMKSDAEYGQAISTSTNNILVRQLANRIFKALNDAGFKNNVGEKKLFEWLRQNSYLIRQPKSRDYNMPTKRSLDMGIMEGKLTPIEHKTLPETWNSGTPEITEKGAKYFTLKFLKIYEDGGSIEDSIKSKGGK